MATIAEIREKYPQYADMPDAALADALHSKFYADMPKTDFYAKIGFAPQYGSAVPSATPTRQPDAIPSARAPSRGVMDYIAGIPETAITAGTTTITFKFGQPPFALPGETIFSFIAAPGTSNALDLSELKELTSSTLGGRGTYPNGPDVLAINVFKSSGAATPSNIVLRWGEAQA